MDDGGFHRPRNAGSASPSIGGVRNCALQYGKLEMTRSTSEVAVSRSAVDELLTRFGQLAGPLVELRLQIGPIADARLAFVPVERGLRLCVRFFAPFARQGHPRSASMDPGPLGQRL